MTALVTLLPLLAPGDDSVPGALDALASLDIRTDVDLLFTSALPPHATLSPDTLARLRTLVASHVSAPATSGSYLLQQSRDRKGKRPQRFSTSLEDLDDHIGGGFDSGEIVEVTGPHRSGRTALALYIVLLHLLLHDDKRAALLDTTGSFDAFRCLAILRDVLVPKMYALGGSFAGEDGAEPSAEDLAISVLDRLAVSRVAKSGDALDVLAAEVRSDEKDEVLDMVVVDSLDTLVGGEALASGSAQANANLIAFMRRLATLARSKSAPLTVITVTSLGTPAAKGSHTAPIPPNLPQQPPPLSSLPHPIPLKPALGSIFAYLVDISLVVSPAEPLFGPDDGRDRGFVEVARNVRGETGGMVEFKLEKGVRFEQVD